MKKLFLWAVLCVAAAFSSCSKHDNEINDVEPPVPPETTPLAIAFAEGNSLQFDVDETKIVHYTITGGSENTVVKAELQSPNNAYTVETAPTSATQGTIMITAKMLSTYNRILVSVSDGDQSVSAEITVSTTSKITITVETPGTLSQLLADYDATKIRELTVIGNLNSLDIKTLKDLSELAVLDMEQVNLEVLPTDAFYEKTSLKSVKLPKTLKIIGNYVFSGCSNLRRITIPNSVTTIGSSAFGRCYNLTSVTIPDGVTSIGNSTFSGCSSLTSITIPNSVTTIGDYAFHECSSLTSITIPNSVTTIGDSAFSRCSSLSAFYGKFASSDNRCLIVSSKLIAVATADLTSYIISDRVKEIGGSAFSGCSNLISITIPDSVTKIGSSAFSDCVSLTSIAIPDHVTEIDSFAFSGCSSLESITIPDSMTTIGMSTFSSCSRLTAIYCKAIVPPSVSIHGAFNGVSATLYVPTGCKAAYAAATGWKSFTIIETQF